jgi:hypothetical protein
MFRAIQIDNFPPFGKLQIAFQIVPDKPEDLAEVHLLTGVNGTGKTRILCALAALLGNSEPLRKRLTAETSFDIGIAEDLRSDRIPEWPGVMHVTPTSMNWVRLEGKMKWTDQIPAFAYSGTAYVADMPVTPMATLNRQSRQGDLSFTKPPEQSTYLLQGITNLKLQAAMDSLNQPPGATRSRATLLITALESTISEITEMLFRFHVTPYPTTISLQVHWGDTDLSFNLLPDGLRSIIGWLVNAIVMMDLVLQGKGDPMTTPAIFLLDEIESHLHPAWQRRILPAFQKLFPKSQIFVATHSPFLIASLNHGWVHPFTLLTDGTARAEQPVPASEGDSYLTVIEDIMGLKELYDPETEKLLADFRAQRNAAYHGDDAASTKARELADQIGKRSLELEYMMGRELSQMDRQLQKAARSG